jgi:hypothetical protein
VSANLFLLSQHKHNCRGCCSAQLIDNVSLARIC